MRFTWLVFYKITGVFPAIIFLLYNAHISTTSFFLKGVVTLREVATIFDQGAHHPTMLVVLQALVALIGEVKNLYTDEF